MCIAEDRGLKVEIWACTLKIKSTDIKTNFVIFLMGDY